MTETTKTPQELFSDFMKANNLTMTFDLRHPIENGVADMTKILPIINVIEVPTTTQTPESVETTK